MESKHYKNSQEEDSRHSNPIEDTDENIAQNTENEENTDDCEERYSKLNDSYVRLMAEFDNYRKRTAKERIEFISIASEQVIVDILPVVDNMERALQNMDSSTDLAAVKQGLELIYQQLLSVLKRHGVKQIETADGNFDTEYHEAITTIPALTAEQKGKIVDCTLKGYTLNDKVIRHSKVVIGE